MLASLLSSELHTVDDVATLDIEESAELFKELHAAAVPLGDRSRLRKVVGGSRGASGPNMRHSKRDRRLQQELEQEIQKKEPKDRASISADTIALMVTACL
jgi:hypothetical protein